MMNKILSASDRTTGWIRIESESAVEIMVGHDARYSIEHSRFEPDDEFQAPFVSRESTVAERHTLAPGWVRVTSDGIGRVRVGIVTL